jgi:DNA-binding MarR family transcriptional regulator
MSKAKVFSVNTPEESSGFLLWQVTNLWQRGIRNALAEYNITHSQFVLLASTMWLSHGAAPVTQVLLSNHTKIDPMTTSTVLRTLQGKGLVKRREHETDTRAKTIELTEAGVATAQLAVKKVEQFDRDFFSLLGEDGSNFNRQLIVLLGRENL